MKGFGGESRRKPPTDMMAHPDLFAMMMRRFPSAGRISNAPQAVAEVSYEDLSAAKEELDLFDDATKGVQVAERFMTAPSPGIIATTMLNAHYDSHGAYVSALAREMKKEYTLIASRDLVLQIDSPDLAMERTMMWQDKSVAQFLDIARMHVAALNEAIAGIPKEQVRLHCCWGNWEGPHVHDVPLAEILPVLYGAKVGALSLEFANPRHQHELAAFKTNRFPDDQVLIPGVLDSTTNYVEHPEVVANRIEAAARAVGDSTRVIAGTDCGFGTFAGYEFIAPSIVWAKLRGMADGASIATKRLRA
jgi:5-methyltetrahydropteroyltriglutamate--homocysteine methyltransferase